MLLFTRLPAEQTLPASSGASLASLLVPQGCPPPPQGSVQAPWTPGPECSGAHLGPRSPCQREQGASGLENNRKKNSSLLVCATRYLG